LSYGGTFGCLDPRTGRG